MHPALHESVNTFFSTSVSEMTPIGFWFPSTTYARWTRVSRNFKTNSSTVVAPDTAIGPGICKLMIQKKKTKSMQGWTYQLVLRNKLDECRNRQVHLREVILNDLRLPVRWRRVHVTNIPSCQIRWGYHTVSRRHPQQPLHWCSTMRRCVRPLNVTLSIIYNTSKYHAFKYTQCRHSDCNS